MDPLRSFLADIVDYAGLFPPSRLPMDQAVREYAQRRGTAEAWMLAAFVVPSSRLDEFEACAAPFFPRGGSAPAWRLSVLLGADWAADLQRVSDFAGRHGEGPGEAQVQVVALETRPAAPDSLNALVQAAPSGVEIFCEVAPADPELDHWIEAIAALGIRAKLRTGGVEASAFPTASEVARFLQVCSARRVGLKFTAGLHHPVRSEHALTYDADAPRGVMHGFLNVFTAAALVESGRSTFDELVAALEEGDPAAFAVEGDGWRWRDRHFSAGTLSHLRAHFARSFGSCSFAEPVADLQSMKLL